MQESISLGAQLVHKSPQTAPIQNQTNSICTPIALFIIFFNFIIILRLLLCLPSSYFPSSFPTKMYAFLIFYIRAIWPANLIILDLIVLIICAKYKPWQRLILQLYSPSCHFTPHRSPHILLSTLFSNRVSICGLPLTWIQRFTFVKSG